MRDMTVCLILINTDFAWVIKLWRVLPLTEISLSINWIHLCMATVVEFSKVGCKRIAERLWHYIIAKNFNRLACVIEEIPNQLLAVCGSILRWSVFWRPLIRALIGAVSSLHELLKPIVDSRLHCRERLCAKEVLIHCVGIVLPEVLAIPRISNGIGVGKGSTRAIDVILSW